MTYRRHQPRTVIALEAIDLSAMSHKDVTLPYSADLAVDLLVIARSVTRAGDRLWFRGVAQGRQWTVILEDAPS